MRRHTVSASELAQYIGRPAMLPVQRGKWKIMVAVTILDARERWGTADVMIEPVSGEGIAWVELSALNLNGS